jgi:hypothetical protein
MSRALARFGEGSLLFQEFTMREPVPLAGIHQAVLEFLRGRKDAVLFGAHAVNAYVSEPRMTQDVDILALNAHELAQEIRAELNRRFHIAVRVRRIKGGVGFRIFQLQKPRNRHFVDVRPVTELPPTQRLAQIMVVAPAELIAAKVRSAHGRRGQAKEFTDWRDLAVLLQTFPNLKKRHGAVRERLLAAGADEALLALWDEVVARKFRPADDDSEFNG